MSDISSFDESAEPNPRYRGNILIASLPRLLNEAEISACLAHQPPVRDKSFRMLPLQVRLEGLADLQEIFLPFPWHVAAFEQIISLIRWGYSARDPANPRVMEMLYRLATAGDLPGLLRQTKSGGGSIGILVWGITGAGKTSFLDRFVEYVCKRPVIYHWKVGGQACRWPQIPLVRVQCPPKADLTALGTDILSEIDRLLGTAHAQSANRLSQLEILQRVINNCSCYMVGAVIIDDLQNLREADEDTDILLNFLCNFMEKTGIPLIVSGTYKVHAVLEANTMAASKLTAKGKIEYSRIPEDSISWKNLVAALWDYHVLSFRMEMDPKLPEMLYFHTQGVPRILREMMVVLHTRMAKGVFVKEETGAFARCELTEVTQALLDDIAATELSKYQEALAVLRRYSKKLSFSNDAAYYEDLIPPVAGIAALRHAIEKRDAPKSNAAPESAENNTKPDHKKNEPEDSGLVPPTQDKRQQTALINSITKAQEPYIRCRELCWIPRSVTELGR